MLCLRRERWVPQEGGGGMHIPLNSSPVPSNCISNSFGGEVKIVEYAEENSNEPWALQESASGALAHSGVRDADTNGRLADNNASSLEVARSHEPMDFEDDSSLGISNKQCGTRKRGSDEQAPDSSAGKRKVGASSLLAAKTSENQLSTANLSNASNGINSLERSNLNKASAASNLERNLSSRPTFKYSNKDKGPYIVHVHSNNFEQGKTPLLCQWPD